MPTINDPSIALGKDFTKLSEPENFTKWTKIVTKPNALAFLTIEQTANARNTTQKTVPDNRQFRISVYNTRPNKRKDYDQTSCSAHALLHAAVEPSIWTEIENPLSPACAMKAIIKNINSKTPYEDLIQRARVSIYSVWTCIPENPTQIRQFLM
ncbi:hypothetical protein G6011_09656 [Alternaria panax]|uniref:Uncharacterized protein n=1 Tax=Alternaria panax TaxID=48097 RepID=A0AAD4FAV5_9PLEO|nr:hypothetical protein G6011_09656 [Alternaria panax]